ncbi:GerAB/ArcD/ProY family transporter [Paenibacillus naphthalenovorans]|uniref:GerAB/ArcD/ProY family transporter n=1 Tax=Paenibacillus naphthalenovorans TaxID=162209 RepID=UPI003D2BEC75
MREFSIFEKSSANGGIYAMLIVNRLQLLYFALMLPMYLIHSYMIWGIIVMGILSQINLTLLSKWFSSDTSPKDYHGFVQLFGEGTVRMFALVGWVLILVKITVITLSYVEVIHYFVFPSMNIYWLILFAFSISCYLAVTGMEKVIRFVVITFLASFSIILFFVPFFIPPVASLYDLYPLIPTNWSMDSWKGLLFIWSALSGPEYLVCLLPWLDKGPKLFRYVFAANALSVLEYVIIFAAALFFYGSNYLSKSEFPVVNMIRYLESPVFERIDMIFISFNLFHFVFVTAIFILFFYGATRIMLGKQDKPPTRTGFYASCMFICLCLLIANVSFWQEGIEHSIGLILEVCLSALSYLLVPAILVVAGKLKGRV